MRRATRWLEQHYFGGYRGVLLDAAQRAALEAARGRASSAPESPHAAQLASQLCSALVGGAALGANFAGRIRPEAPSRARTRARHARDLVSARAPGGRGERDGRDPPRGRAASSMSVAATRARDGGLA